MISELNTWPACTPDPCHTRDVAVTSVGLGAERLAGPFSYDSFIRDSRPVYPGAFSDPLFRFGNLEHWSGENFGPIPQKPYTIMIGGFFLYAIAMFIWCMSATRPVSRES